MAGSYAEYKTSTELFTGWIITTCASLEKATKKLPDTLSSLIQRVERITACRDPILLSLRLAEGSDSPLASFVPKVLAAGSKAIRLRVEMGRIYAAKLKKQPADVESDDRHRHCNSVLKECHKKLIMWYKVVVPLISSFQGSGESGKGPVGGSKSSSGSNYNYFEVLSEEDISDITNDMDSLEISDSSTINSSVKTVAEGMTLEQMDNQFGTLRLAVLFLMMDLKGVVDEVTKHWQTVADAVKTVSDALCSEDSTKGDGIDTLPMITAATVTAAALRACDTLFSQFQLDFPSTVTAADFLLGVAKEYLSTEAIGSSSLSSFYSEMLSLMKILIDFKEKLLKPAGLSHLIHYVNNGKIASDYGDPDSPVLVEHLNEIPFVQSARKMGDGKIYTDAETINCTTDFFMSQLTMLFNELRSSIDERDCKFASFPTMKGFLDCILDFFITKEINMSLVVRILVWKRSVDVLQSSKYLTMGRCIYITRLYSRRVLRSVSFDSPLLTDLRTAMMCLGFPMEPGSEYNFSMESFAIFGHNPILSALHLVDLLVANAVRASIPQIHQVCRLYAALQKEGFVHTAIPFLDTVIDQLKDYIFSGAEVPAKGSYLTSSLVKDGKSIGLISEMKGNLEPRMRKRINMKNIWERCSRLPNILYKNDLSILVNNSPNGLTILEMLQSVGQLAEEDFFRNRILSIECTKLMRVFNSLLLRLKRELQPKYFPSMGSWLSPPKGMPANYQLKHVVSIAVPFSEQMNYLVLNELDKNEAPSSLITALSKDVIRIMTDHFEGVEVESEVFILPAPSKGMFKNLWEREFGYQLPEEYGLYAVSSNTFLAELGIDRTQTAWDMFCSITDELLKLVRVENGVKRITIPASLLEKFKEIITTEPRILQFCDDTNDLPTIFDYLLIGDSAVMPFAEWIVQMKGLHLRGGFYQRYSARKGNSKDRPPCCSSHLHIASKYNNFWAAEFVLTVSQQRDIEFQNYTDGNTALHYAFQTGNADLIKLLIFMHPPFLNAANHDGKMPTDIIVNQEVADFVKTMTKNGAKVSIEEYNSIHAKRISDGVAKVSASTATAQKKAVKARKKAREAAAQMQITEEDHKKAEQAAKELLELIEREDRLDAINSKDNKSSNKSNSNKQKKKR